MTLVLLLALAADATQTAYDKLVAEHDAALAAFREAFDAAATPKDKQAAFDAKFPKPAAFAPRFLAVARDGEDSPAALDALAWVVLHPVEPGLEEARLRGLALRLLSRRHVKDVRLGSLCTRLVLTVDADSERLLRAASDGATAKPAAARALASLAHNLRHRAGLIGRLKDDKEGLAEYERLWGKPAMAALVKGEPAALEKESREQFERLAAKYGDVAHPLHGTFGRFAAAHLAAMRDPVAADKPAPEIVGTTLDGTKRKLSDYRGKVVLLDFWSHAFGPSRDQFAAQKRLLARMDGKPFAMLGVNADGERAAAAKASEAARLTWPSWFDGGGTGGPAATRWDIDQWPSVVLIDHKGVIRHLWAGWPDEKELAKAIAELIEKAK